MRSHRTVIAMENRRTRVERLLEDCGPVLIGRDLPVSRSTLLRAARVGELIQVLPGTFLAPGVAGDLRWRMVAACRWRPDAVVCGAAVAQVSFWPELTVDVIDVAVRTPAERTGFRFSRRVIPDDHLVHRGQVRLSSPALAAVDLISEYGGDAIDRALRSRQITLSMLWSALAATSRRDGNKERRRLLIESREAPWSAAERLAHQEFRNRGLRGWVANHRIVLDQKDYYPDLAFRGVRLAVEIDGFEHHSDRAAFERDRFRQNVLVRAGWTVLRFTYRQLLEDPRGVVEMVRDVLRQLERTQRSGRQTSARAR